MRRLWNRIKRAFSGQRTPTERTPPNIVEDNSPNTPDFDDVPEQLYQRLPELPISRGRKMKPLALVVHYTAGWQNQRAFDALTYMQRMNHGYLFIDKWGSCWQNIMLDESYVHAGGSVMPSFSMLKGRRSVDSFAIGIEVAAGGQVNASNKTWFGKTVPTEDIRRGDMSVHGTRGRFEKFNDEQEETLFNVCVDLCKRFDIHPSNVVGHHEISPSRRDDPGAAIEIGMHRFRAKIADELNKK